MIKRSLVCVLLTVATAGGVATLAAPGVSLAADNALMCPEEIPDDLVCFHDAAVITVDASIGGHTIQPKVGDYEVCKANTHTLGGAFTRQVTFYRDGVQLVSLTWNFPADPVDNNSYKVQPADVGHSLSCRYSMTSGGQTITSTSSNTHKVAPLAPITKNGTSGNDKMTAPTGQPVRYFGLGGNDTLVGNSALDSLDGGAGNDVLRGLGGIDKLLGGNGNDVLDGGIDSDVLIGGPGNDRLFGGAGKDTFNAGVGNDTVTSRDGVAETVSCGAGSDTVIAGKDDRVAGDCEVVKRA